MRQIALLFSLILILVACGSETAPQQIATIQELPTTTKTTEPATEDSFNNPTPTEAPLVLSPTVSPVVPNTQQPVEIPTENNVTEAAETPTSIPAEINGQYENTYFRGLATAPITLIDYSDFL